MMRRHPADLVSLMFGLLFLAAGSVLLSDHLDLLGDLRWAGPAVLIVVAMAMLASLRGSSGPARAGSAMPPVDELRPPNVDD